MRGRYSKVAFPTESLVKIDGEKDVTFPSIESGELYFAKKKKDLKGTMTLMALYKKVNGKWIGIKHN
jgi:hypothetical protein